MLGKRLAVGGVGFGEAQVLEERYRLLERLGVGGMSVVWRGYDEVLGRQVAIKMLAPALAPDHASRNRIRAEAQAVARLCHPHITSVYDYGEARRADGDTVPYVVMELIDGEPMSARLRHGAALPWHEAITASAQVASALAVAHACGIVHRDVTPNNVMLTLVGAKVVDFGISALVGENDVGPDGTLLGTPAYLAPERMDAGVVCPATDVYALGLLLYRSLTGQLPWPAVSTTDLLKAHRYADPGPMPQVPGLPEAVVDLCNRCLAKRPEDRPSSAGVARTLAAEAGIVVFLPGPARLSYAAAPVAADARLAAADHPGWEADVNRPAGRAYRAGEVAPARAAGGLPARVAGGLPAGGHPLGEAAAGDILAGGAVAGGILAGNAPADDMPVSLGTTIRPWPPPAAPARPAPALSPRGEPRVPLLSPALASLRRFAARRRTEAVLAGVVLLTATGLAWFGSSRAPDGTGAGAIAGGQPLALGLGSQPAGCRVAYRLRADTGSEFSAAVTVINTGRRSVDDWRLEFAFPGDQRLKWGTGAVWRQSGRFVMVRPATAQRLRPDSPVRMAVYGGYRSTNALPVVFTLNDKPCQALVAGVDANLAVARSGKGDRPSGRGSADGATTRTAGRDGGRDGARQRGDGRTGANGKGGVNGNGNRPGRDEPRKPRKLNRYPDGRDILPLPGGAHDADLPDDLDPLDQPGPWQDPLPDDGWGDEPMTDELWGGGWGDEEWDDERWDEGEEDEDGRWPGRGRGRWEAGDGVGPPCGRGDGVQT